MFQKILTILIYSLVFLIPIFWLPFTAEGFEFNKNYLLIFLISIGFFVWMSEIIFKTKQIKLQKNPLDFFVGVFLLIMILNAVFSVDKIASIFGSYNRFWPNLIGILCLTGFYFLVVNNVCAENENNKILKREKIKTDVKNPKFQNIIQNNVQKFKEFFKEFKELIFNLKLTTNGLLATFLISSFIVLLIACLSLLKNWPAKFFNPVGFSFEQMAMFLTVVFVFLVCFLAFTEKRKIWLYFFVFAIFLSLVFIDFWSSWMVISLSLILFLAFVFWKKIFQENINRLSLTIIFLLISLIFLFFNPADFFQKNGQSKNIIPETLLPQKTGWEIGFNGFRENIIFGSGNGTFNYLFNKFKPPEQPQFDRSGNHFSEILGTTGILGILSYLGLIGAFLIFSIRNLLFKIKNSEFRIQASLLFGFIACLISQFFYYQTTVLAFSFWFFLSLNVLNWKIGAREKIIDFKDFPNIGLTFLILFWIIFILFAFCYFVLIKNYISDIHFKNYLLNRGDPIINLEKAVQTGVLVSKYDEKTNNILYWYALRPEIHLHLAQRYFIEGYNELLKFPSDIQSASKKIDLALTEAEKARESSNRADVYQFSGLVYSQLQGFLDGSREWAIKMFEKGLELAPANPIILTELGKIKIIENKNDEAKILFNRALMGQKDYFDAKIQLALLDEKENKKQEAIQRLEELLTQNPYIVEAWFQLGRIYYNQNEIDRAFNSFQNAIGIMPNHSNSLYSLGLIYEKRGEKENALKEFRKVLEFNPENNIIIKKIEELEKSESEKSENK